MATLEVVNLNYSSYKTTTLTQYANLGHVKELLEKKHPATTDARCKYENYTITSIQGFLRIRAPEALTAVRSIKRVRTWHGNLMC